MAYSGNRKRTPKKEPEAHFLWGSLLRKERPGEEAQEDFMRRTTFTRGDEAYDEDEEYGGGATAFAVWKRLWSGFSIWNLVAVCLFVSFSLCLLITLVKMWVPQDLSDISGYNDTAGARDLTAIIRNANGAPVTITEAELNRYLRDTCRMRQTGIFSIITHGQGIAVRIHNGYMELVLDRTIGANMHQTTAVYLSFSQENNLGTPELRVDFRNNAPLFGAMPNGGSIGHIALPQRHIHMLRPALESLLSCYPEIVETIRQYHYCPVFTANGSERCITLVPYTPS